MRALAGAVLAGVLPPLTLRYCTAANKLNLFDKETGKVRHGVQVIVRVAFTRAGFPALPECTREHLLCSSLT